MTTSLLDLLERCRQGDASSFAVIVGRFRNWAHDLAWSILRDEHLAEDVVQEAFLKAYSRLEELRDLEAFPGWLRQILRSEACGIARTRRRRLLENRTPWMPDQPDPSERVEREELCRRVHRALKSLSPINRQTAELFYLSEHDCGQIAEMLHVPQGTVRRRLHDVRQKLRTMLEEHEQVEYV